MELYVIKLLNGKGERIIKNILVIIIGVIFLSGCSSSNNNYKVLTEEQRNEVIESNNFNVKTTSDIGKELTVIMFEEEGYNGYYAASSNKDGEIISQIYKVEKGSAPVTISGIATDIPFVAVSINSEEILKKGKYIYIEWEDGLSQQVELNNQSHVIIPYEEKSSNENKTYSYIIIYDKDNNILFDSSN